MADELALLDGGRPVSFAFPDLLRYHGSGSPGGVAHAYKVLERALPLLSPGGPPDRRAITIRTAFGGPGARDGFELVTRAVTEDRYVVDAALTRPALGLARERFVFVLEHAQSAFTLVLRPGYVSDDFVLLARLPERSDAEEQRLAALKLELMRTVMAAPAAAVYDAEPYGEAADG